MKCGNFCLKIRKLQFSSVLQSSSWQRDGSIIRGVKKNLICGENYIYSTNGYNMFIEQMTCYVIDQLTYRADDMYSKRRDLWAIEQMVNRANTHIANGIRADVIAPDLIILIQTILSNYNKLFFQILVWVLSRLHEDRELEDVRRMQDGRILWEGWTEEGLDKP